MPERCEKSDAWEAQRERNERYDRMFDKIEQHLGEQTALMREIARQGEQILTLQREQKDNRHLIDKLFERLREMEKDLAEFRAQIADRFHQHEVEPAKEQRVERLRFSTGAWLLVVAALINHLFSLIKDALLRSGPPGP